VLVCKCNNPVLVWTVPNTTLNSIARVCKETEESPHSESDCVDWLARQDVKEREPVLFVQDAEIPHSYLMEAASPRNLRSGGT
jgi:hypothetical protein